MFRYLHKNLEQDELKTIEELERDVGNLNHNLYQAHQLIRAFLNKNSTQDIRDINAQLKGHLIEAEKLLKKMNILDHHLIEEVEEKENAFVKLDEYTTSLMKKYSVKIIPNSDRTMIKIMDLEDNLIAEIKNPILEIQDESYPNMKRIIDDTFLPIFNKHRLLGLKAFHRPFKVTFIGNAEERLKKMNMRIKDDALFTQNGVYHLNEGIPTKELIFAPDPKSHLFIILECINVKDEHTKFILDHQGLTEL